jgi:hypothetical protein
MAVEDLARKRGFFPETDITMSLSFFEDLLEKLVSDPFYEDATTTTGKRAAPQDLLASIEYTWRGGVESPEVAEAIADFGSENTVNTMDLPCLSQTEVKAEEDDICVPSPDSGIGACYDLDSSALLCGAADPILGLPFEMDFFEASTSTAHGADETEEDYSTVAADSSLGGAKEDGEIVLSDTYMDTCDPLVSEEAIKEAPVIICDVTPIDIGEATALAKLPSAEASGIQFSKSVHSYPTRAPLKRRKKGGLVRSADAGRQPSSKLVVHVKPFTVSSPAADESFATSKASSLNKSRSATTTSSRKRKLYEMGPLDNPDDERCRLNALNAKKNREKKKRQLAEAAAEIQRLRNENSELRNQADQVRDQLEQARLELARLRAQLKADGSPAGAASLGNRKLQQMKIV